MRTDWLFPTTVLLAASLTGCATSSPDQTVMSTQGATVVRAAQVTNVRDVTLRGGRPSGLGSFVGAILGGVAGSKIGSGTGSTAAGIGGAVAGSMAGQRVEESRIGRKTTELTLRFENGDIQTYQVDPDDSYRVGDMVDVTTNRGVTRVSRLAAQPQ
jgi:outer membrane lipoprotein SlyB